MRSFNGRPKNRNFNPHIPDFKAFSKSFTDFALNIAYAEVKAFAEKEKTQFVHDLRQQKFQAFGAKPLRTSTLAAKRRWHRSLKTMICTGTYLASIAVHENDAHIPGSKIDKQFVVGIDPAIRAVDITGKTRKLVSLNDVARWNEFGAPRRLPVDRRGHPPSRPHWGPFLAEMEKRARAVRRKIARLAAEKFNATMKP